SQSADSTTTASTATNSTYIATRPSLRRVVRRIATLRPPPPAGAGRVVSALGGEGAVVDLVVGALVAHRPELLVHGGEQVRLLALGEGEAVALLGVVLLDDHVARVGLGVLDVDREVLEDALDRAALQRRPQLAVGGELDQLGALGRVLLGVGLARGALLHTEAAAEVVEAGDAAVGRHQQRLQRVVVRVGEVEVLRPLLGDRHRRGADVALTGAEHRTGLQRVERDVLHREREVEPGRDLLHDVHVEAAVAALGGGVLDLERRVGDVGAHGQRAVGDELEAARVAPAVTAGLAAVAAVAAATAGGECERSDRGERPGGRESCGGSGSGRDGHAAPPGRGVVVRGASWLPHPAIWRS